MRDSDLIRKLRASGMNFRETDRIAKCSTGAVSAEMRAMKAEAIIRAAKLALEESLTPKLEIEKGLKVSQSASGSDYQGHVYDFDNQEVRIELEY